MRRGFEKMTGTTYLYALQISQGRATGKSRDFAVELTVTHTECRGQEVDVDVLTTVKPFVNAVGDLRQESTIHIREVNLVLGLLLHVLFFFWRSFFFGKLLPQQFALL